MCMIDPKPVEPPQEHEFYKVMLLLEDGRLRSEWTLRKYAVGEEHAAENIRASGSPYTDLGLARTTYDPGFHGLDQIDAAELYRINAAKSVFPQRVPKKETEEWRVVRCRGRVRLTGKFVVGLHGTEQEGTVLGPGVVADTMTILEVYPNEHPR